MHPCAIYTHGYSLEPYLCMSAEESFAVRGRNHFLAKRILQHQEEKDREAGEWLHGDYKLWPFTHRCGKRSDECNKHRRDGNG